MEFYNKAQIKRIAEFDEKADELGCLAVDAWAEGSGWRKKYRALPPGVFKYSRGEDALSPWSNCLVGILAGREYYGLVVNG